VRKLELFHEKARTSSICLSSSLEHEDQGTFPQAGRGISMKHNLMLTISTLLSILFMTFHMTQDTLQVFLDTEANKW
jgi:hypothetical protein